MKKRKVEGKVIKNIQKIVFLHKLCLMINTLELCLIR